MKRKRIKDYMKITGFIFIIMVAFQPVAATSSFAIDTIIADLTLCDDTVKIMNDVYIPDSVTLTICEGTVIQFQGHFTVEVHGRIVADGAPDGQEIMFTSADKDEGWRGMKIVDTDYNALDTCVFNYCIFEYGYATDGNELAYDQLYDAGGAFYISISSKVKITNSDFGNNRAERFGGALYAEWSNIIMERNRFYENEASGPNGMGGAVYNYYSRIWFQRNTLFRNTAKNGGAIFSNRGMTKIVHNHFSANTSDYHGGCIYFGSSSADTLIGNIIRKNSSDYGGALYFSSGNGYLINNTIVGNMAQIQGGAIICNHSFPVFENTIIWDNVENGVSHQLNFYDTISKPVFRYCDVQGGTAAFTGLGSGEKYDSLKYYIHNINIEPQFSDTNYYRPNRHSICINAGNPGYTADSIGADTDILANPRISYDTVDIGAVEYLNHQPLDIVLTSNQIDEGLPVSGTVGILSCTDADTSDLHTFMLVPGEGDDNNADFFIDGDTLKISVLSDFENKNTYTVRVRVTDNGAIPMYSENLLLIQIQNVNEAPDDILLSGNTIPENSPAGTTIGSITISDPDNGSDGLTAELQSGVNDNDAFGIEDGALVSDIIFDYEEKNEYLITILVRDDGGLTFEKEFTIDITDEFETGSDMNLSTGMISIYPNPVSENELLVIECTNETIRIIRFTDLKGNLYLEKEEINAYRLIQENNAFEAGLYYVNVITDKSSYTRKIVVY